MTCCNFQNDITYAELFLGIIILWLSLNNTNENMIFGHLLSGWLFITVQYGRKIKKFFSG